MNCRIKLQLEVVADSMKQIQKVDRTDLSAVEHRLEP